MTPSPTHGIWQMRVSRGNHAFAAQCAGMAGTRKQQFINSSPYTKNSDYIRTQLIETPQRKPSEDISKQATLIISVFALTLAFTISTADTATIGKIMENTEQDIIQDLKWNQWKMG